MLGDGKVVSSAILVRRGIRKGLQCWATVRCNVVATCGVMVVYGKD